MTSKELLYVKTIYEEKNFSQAADKLGITQSALSHCLTNIEKALGEPLFLRGSRTVIPTECGNIYYKTAQEILTKYDNMISIIGDLKQSPSGDLAVGFSRLLASKFLHRVLPEYMSLYPNVHLTILEESTLSVLKETVSKRLDCAIIMHEFEEQPYSKQLQYKSIAMVPCIVAVPSSTVFDEKFLCESTVGDIPVLSPYALADMSIIEIVRSTYQNKVQANVFENAGFSPKKLLSIHNWETAVNLIKEGLGYALIPRLCVDKLKSDGIHYYYLPEQYKAYWQISTIQNKDLGMSLAKRNFIEMLENVINEICRYS